LEESRNGARGRRTLGEGGGKGGVLRKKRGISFLLREGEGKETTCRRRSDAGMVDAEGDLVCGPMAKRRGAEK